MITILFFLSSLISLPPFSQAANDGETDTILAAAESHFQAIKDSSYREIWALLTVKSRKTITGELSKSLKGTYSREQIAADFAIGGMLARSYWDRFRSTFDPDTVLEESRWEMGRQRGRKAEIIITHKNAERPAILKMYRQEGGWKVGLVETFWTRK